MGMDPKSKSQMRNLEAERRNPCHKESQLSYECLDKNNYDKDACTQHFDNYKACKKFWGSSGNKDLEEREKIKNQLRKLRKKTSES